MQRNKPLTSIGDVLSKYKLEDSDKYISREFQKYAYDLAEELGDLDHKSLYMKLAKDTPRILLEKARSFVKDAQNARSKGRLFMWKLQQLKNETKAKNEKK
ncbi:MAG: hypothetical protein UV71_C0003G0039 [Microgenomates group bacterium GW2011_GWC1_43_13]|uniref:Uncharacterized protein n=2 Tax=Candidatus Woeseibacteriota TaxID=1752722 RepID=A0A837ICB7_9BACT|nr:MAG: hypothetical protein UV71_C0003G0039 [Microgenomates group bacterium GW2011_GWC1_43_13]KKT33421.1 MAG: hypothetical protein UW20_C0002G0012 [Candidatus Woesebacteria bacterium GW2011_GWB1_44_11]KKT54846.1 MAG: hypothetical protein UW47_C0002G0030 [Candidatus Woesebacteria bacterium GW2011_GWA1_44_23]OGM76007.1 MAG: hypothetical protein A2208_02930 [Candidatus Woesebacteria bacterium RIFOXYA1_FULL_43_16]OGM81965.1 MAG: hypothetical protein A2394_03095 [Candidatus Woesebacteria bacterium 